MGSCVGVVYPSTSTASCGGSSDSVAASRIASISSTGRFGLAATASVVSGSSKSSSEHLPKAYVGVGCEDVEEFVGPFASVHDGDDVGAGMIQEPQHQGVGKGGVVARAAQAGVVDQQGVLLARGMTGTDPREGSAAR